MPITGRSKCRNCGHQISWLENIPIISYLALHGKCKNCGAKINKYYFLIEIATGLLCMLICLGDDSIILKIALIFFTFIGISISAIDFEFQKIPNGLNYALFLTLVSILSWEAYSTDEIGNLGQSFIISTLSFIAFLSIASLSKGGMGMGDVKFAPSIGMISGYFGILETYLSFMLAFFIGSLYGITLMALKSLTQKTKIPFGPFMFIGTYLILLLRNL